MKKHLPLIVVAAIVAIVVGFNISRKDRNYRDDGQNPKEKFIKFKMHLYMENSGSMDGFVTENTEFKDALEHLLIMLNDKYGTPSISFINNQIYDTLGIDKGITHFCRQLTPKAIHLGNTGSSNINDIFRMILNKTDNNTVSVLVSDCVYSIKGNNAQSLLANQKNLTQNAFMEALKKNNGDLATIVLQCSSKFNGYYYDMNDKEIAYQGRRPYYIIFVGKSAYIKDLYAKMNFTKEDYVGLLNSYTMTSKGISLDEKNSSIITDDNLLANVDRIKPDNRELGIESITTRGGSSFTIAVGVDAGSFFLDSSYYLDKNNYKVEPSTVKVKSVGKIDKQSAAFGDCASFSKPYYLQLEGTNQPSEISVSMIYNIPSWVYSSSTDDDSHGVPAKNVTFGISYMMEGINAAFKEKNPLKTIFNLKFNINNYK